jgi:hypothetical protein
VATPTKHYFATTSDWMTFVSAPTCTRTAFFDRLEKRLLDAGGDENKPEVLARRLC